MIEQELASAEETEALGAGLARWLQRQRGAVVFLSGELGSGKTTLVRGALRALGITGPIRSPTYTLLEPYRIGERHCLHLDLYRLRGAEEVEQLGLRDYPPESNWWLVEWPERGEGYLPAPAICLRLAHSGAGRTAALSGLAASALAGES